MDGMVMNQSQSFAHIRFDEAELDRTIQELAVPSLLAPPTRRTLAAYLLTAFSMAMALSDSDLYNQSLDELGDPPSDPDEVLFFREFGRALAADLTQELEGMPALEIFNERASELIDRVDLLCH